MTKQMNCESDWGCCCPNQRIISRKWWGNKLPSILCGECYRVIQTKTKFILLVKNVSLVYEFHAHSFVYNDSSLFIVVLAMMIPLKKTHFSAHIFQSNITLYKLKVAYHLIISCEMTKMTETWALIQRAQAFLHKRLMKTRYRSAHIP